MAYTKKSAKKAEEPVVETTETINTVKSENTVETKPTKEEKERTTAAVIELINNNVDSVSSEEAIITKARARDNSIPTDEEIAVRSITFGGLTWISPKTNAHYRWNEIGEVEYITFGELITMNNTSREFLVNPYVILQDERVVNYFRLQPVYEKVAQINNLRDVFNSGDMRKVESVLNTIMDVNMRDVAISKIRDMRDKGELVNYDIIKKIEKILCFDLTNNDNNEE